MALDLNKKNIKRIMLLIAFAALLYWGLNNLKWISGVLGSLLDLLSPLLIGICIAFVLNLMMVALERLWDRGLIKWNSPWNAKLKRPVCLTLTLLLFLGIIFAIFFILIPRLEEAGTTMVANIPTYVNQIQVWWTNLSDFAAEHGVTLPELSLSADQVKDTITGFLQEKGDSVVNTTLNITTSILSALVNFLLALVFSLYLLAQKETLLAQSRRLLRRCLHIGSRQVPVAQTGFGRPEIDQQPFAGKQLVPPHIERHEQESRRDRQRIKQSCEARPTTRVRFIVIRIVIIHRSILTRKTPQGGIPRVSLYSGEVAAMSVKLLALAMRIMATTSSKATDLSQCSETVGFSCPASRDLRAFSTPSREPTFSVST
jgi:hypothetical protein